MVGIQLSGSDRSADCARMTAHTEAVSTGGSVQVRESSRESELPSGLKYAAIRKRRSSEAQKLGIGLSVRPLRQEVWCLFGVYFYRALRRL
jgi:hypothetical protein